MENCLKTQLKAVVNNNNLERLGEININISSGNSININSAWFKSNPTVFLKSGEVSCTIGGEPVTLPVTLTTSQVLTISASTDAVVGYTDKLKQYRLNLGTTNNWRVDTKVFEYSPLDYVIIQIKSVTGDIKYIFKSSNTQAEIQIGYIDSGSYLYGDIRTFGRCLSCNALTLRYQSGIHGPLEDLVAEYVHNGRNNTSIATYLIDGIFSFKEIPLANVPNSNIPLSWGTNSINNQYVDISYNSIETTISIDAEGNWSYVNPDKSKYTG